MFWIIFLISLLLIATFLKSPVGKGYIGELRVRSVIGKTKPGRQYVINNYMLTIEGKSSQIDHIVIRPNGVFVIETKNYSGRIYGSSNQLEWTQVLNFGRIKNKFYNPVKQNATHIYRLRQMMPDDIYLSSVVVFVQNNTAFLNADGVIPLCALKRYLRTPNGALTAEQMQGVYNFLLSHRNEEHITAKMHVKEINETLNKIENNICPRCGSPLVLRKGQFGDFYGCSNYPNCRFKKK